ncbi:segregation/condensation protein A [Candidatus Fermentibacterales bacterium]|nr:segregation/condensation protein A [Candidatus Fermentibacterales bacterium]
MSAERGVAGGLPGLFDQEQLPVRSEAHTCRVDLESFEGPLDLLLYLIRRDEIPVTDIPVAHVADQYLAYLRRAEELDLDIAGEYLVMAAILTNMKSRSLLPSSPDSEDQEEDPREVLMRQLLLYKIVKEAAQELRESEDAWRDVFTPSGERERWSKSPAEVMELPGQSGLLDLLEAYSRIALRHQPPPIQRYRRDPYPLSRCIETISSLLEKRSSCTLKQMAGSGADRMLLVSLFLAVLELVRRGWLRMRQRVPFGDLTVRRTAGWRSGDAQ